MYISALKVLLLLAYSGVCQSGEVLVECYTDAACRYDNETTPQTMMSINQCCFVNHTAWYREGTDGGCTRCTDFLMFSFGPTVGDQLVPPVDDGSSSLIFLREPVNIFQEKERILYVNTNGVLALRKEHSSANPQRMESSFLPSLPLLAPFWADIDITRFGRIWYRQTDESGLLQHAACLLQEYLLVAPDSTFHPTLLFIATWDGVAPFQSSNTRASNLTGQENTFQVALTTDGNKTFLLFIYHTIEWDRPNRVIGFKNANGARHLTVRTSQPTASSNVGLPGLYIYRIDGTECPVGQVTCPFNESECIPSHLLCDGNVDCLDESDEAPSFCPCPGGYARCRESPDECVSIDKFCDNNQDCSDGSDEYSMCNDCQAGEVLCRSPQHSFCFSISSLCSRRNTFNCSMSFAEPPHFCSALFNCNEYTIPSNGDLDVVLTEAGNIANYSCNSGFVLNGDATRLCQDDGNLSGSMPSCLAVSEITPDPEIIVCDSLDSPLNGVVSLPLNPTPGSTASYSCNGGYTLVGEENVTCLENGEWSRSGNQTTCRLIQCERLAPPDNGMMEPPRGRSLGASAIFSCNLGYVRFGEEILTCEESGMWSSSVPTCQIHLAIVVVAPVVIAILILVIALMVFAILCKRNKRQLKRMRTWNVRLTAKDRNTAIYHDSAMNPDNHSSTFYLAADPENDHGDVLGRFRVRSFNRVQSEFEHDLVIHSSNLKILETTGQGEFGVVYKGYLLKDVGQTVLGTVAVKTLKGFLDDSLVKSLLEECIKMQQFDHRNVLSLIGVCLDGGPTPYLVMPFMSNGSLLVYLQKERRNLVICDSEAELEEMKEVTSVALRRLTDMCLQVAEGMEYLAGKKFIHRDLAARNCMIDDNFVIKVADFGLSEQLKSKDYFRQDKGTSVKLPVKWLSPESLTDYVFSEKSDVWAYGVTCWEVFSGGKAPYASINPHQLSSLLEKGYRMEKPANEACSDQMFSIIQHCWKSAASDRPTFSELVEELSRYLESMAGYLHIEAFTQGEDAIGKDNDGDQCYDRLQPNDQNATENSD